MEVKTKAGIRMDSSEQAWDAVWASFHCRGSTRNRHAGKTLSTDEIARINQELFNAFLQL